MINSVKFYRVHSEWPANESDLSDALDNNAFKPCGSFSERSLGFEPPVTHEAVGLARRVGGADIMQLRLQSRVLPLAAVREALAERLQLFRQRTQRDATRKEQRELKEEVYGELLPKALLKSDRLLAYYIESEQVLAIATAAAKQAEDFLDSLRAAFGSLQVVPLTYKKPSQGLLTAVFLGDDVPGFTLGRDCRMRDPSDAKSTVNWYDMQLTDRSVRNHVKGGLMVDQLGIQFDQLIRFSLDQELVLRKLRFEGLSELDEFDDEDPLVRFDAELALVGGALRRLLQALKKQLGGYA